MKVFTYYCRSCNFDILAGMLCWLCPHCGHSLQLLRVSEIQGMEIPDIDEAMESVMEGIEELLRAN